MEVRAFEKLGPVRDAHRPRRVVVTGCAGFVGSHLSERLLSLDYEVHGVDCFTDYYARPAKEANLERLRDVPAFTFSALDLSRDDVTSLFEGVDTVYHLAGQPGVRLSFGTSFGEYLRHNVLATQRLLEEAARNPVRKFVYASSSSVYGNAPAYPTAETSPTAPVSPYGMTKLATEQLAGVYARNFGIPVIGLRYFTVFGPRQRPDMAFTRFLTRALRGESLPVFGDGSQIRDFTYVSDIVDGTIAAAANGRAHAVYNIGGGNPVVLRDVLDLIERIVGRRLRLDRRPGPIGEARRTGCDGVLAARDLGFVPRVRLEDGLMAQFEWVVRGHGLPKAA